MGSRHKSREAAVKILYQADLLRENDHSKLINDMWADDPPENTDRDFTESLVSGVSSNIDEIDSKLKELSENWDIERIGYLERAILRLGLYEILFDTSTPSKVSIDEAIELAKTFCEPASARFINGVLDKALKNKDV